MLLPEGEREFMKQFYNYVVDLEEEQEMQKQAAENKKEKEGGQA